MQESRSARHNLITRPLPFFALPWSCTQMPQYSSFSFFSSFLTRQEFIFLETQFEMVGCGSAPISPEFHAV
jgi:hypothetical protein